jgi:hypothetical protein
MNSVFRERRLCAETGPWTEAHPAERNPYGWEA